MGKLEEVIEIWGGLWELPLDVGEALGDGCLSECLLFHLQRYFDHFHGYMEFEQWVHKYRIVKEKKPATKQKKEQYVTATMSTERAHQINKQMVLFVTGASHAILNAEEEALSNDDADSMLIEEVVNIILPVTHLVILDMHMPTEVIEHVNLKSIVTLALPAKYLNACRDRLLVDSPATRLPLHLLIFRIDKEDRKELVEALTHLCLNLHLEGLVLGSSFHHDPTAPALWSEVVGHLMSRGNRCLPYLGME